jgi:ATP-dependent RNA helicase DeaD
MTEGKFEVLGISDEVLRAVRSVGWEVPTPVQTAAIPLEMEGDDILALAQTGTGKTGAYGAAILSKTEPNGKDPSALVLVPTRELATQVSDQLNALSKFSGHRCFPVYGGVNIEHQVKDLSKGVDVLIATPGRLKDLLERKTVSLGGVRIVVLDEADRMLDMGFAPSVNMILSKVPKDRQTLMFSATMNDDVKKLAVRHMINHRELSLNPEEPTVELTAQYYVPTVRDSKREELEALIDDGNPKMMVFCRTKRKVDYLARKLKRDEYNVAAIHGDMVQNKREKSLREFEEGELRVLIASDVAARGFDIPDVDLVVNYDIPADTETYIHRIGRTGRAGRNGRAITFVNPEDEETLRKIEKDIGRKIVEIKPTSKVYYEQPVPKEEKEQSPKQKAKAERRKEAALREAADAAIKAAQASGEPDRKASGRTLKGQLDRGRKSKAEASAASAQTGKKKKGRDQSQPRQERQQPSQKDRQQKSRYPQPQGVPEHPKLLHKYVKIDRAAPPEKDMSFDRIEIFVGSDDGIDEEKLLKFIIKTAGVRREDIGNVHIYPNKSRVQVVRWRSQEVVDELFGQTVNGRRVLVSNLSDRQ